MQKFIVASKVPNAGLGNMLLVWARAVAFAHLNDLPMQAPDWKTLHIGPWLRREKCKRYYGNFFHNRNYQSIFVSNLKHFGKPKIIHSNPSITRLDLSHSDFQAVGQHIFLFDQMPPWQDYFQGIKELQPVVHQALLNDIHPSILKTILERSTPEIGIHIRLGDYSKPEGRENFAVQRNVSTPIDWYISALKTIRKRAGRDIPAMIFSDGRPAELSPILQLPNVSLSPETSALSDMLTLSRSKLIIGTAHSSFSAWAAYLSQCPSIWDGKRSHLYESILSIEKQQRIYQGGLHTHEPLPDLLAKNIDHVFSGVFASGTVLT
jgi:hypothetical protein